LKTPHTRTWTSHINNLLLDLSITSSATSSDQCQECELPLHRHFVLPATTIHFVYSNPLRPHLEIQPLHNETRNNEAAVAEFFSICSCFRCMRSNDCHVSHNFAIVLRDNCFEYNANLELRTFAGGVSLLLFIGHWLVHAWRLLSILSDCKVPLQICVDRSTRSRRFVVLCFLREHAGIYNLSYDSLHDS